MSTDVSKSTAPDFCRHPRIGEDGFCLDCGARAAIKLNIPKPTPCFQCGAPPCIKEEHMLRGTHSPFANSESLRSEINGGLREIALTELLRDVFKVISHATHRVNKTPPPTKGLTTWECMPDCLKCRIGTVLEAAENSEQKHEANKSKTKPDEPPEIGGA